MFCLEWKIERKENQENSLFIANENGYIEYRIKSLHLSKKYAVAN